jgi:glycosyltransferase involved in cell wall biosynthesis
VRAGLISIIVPVYNAGAYLENCVGSILAQSYTNIEVVLVNDGSTDRSGQICDVFAKNDSRVKVIHKENGGESNARNMGLDNAQGEFIALVDHDDEVEPDMYHRLQESMQNTDADVCICGYKQYFNGYNRFVRVPDEEKLDIQQFFEAYLKDFEKFNILFPMPWNKLYRAKLLSGDSDRGGTKTIRFPEELRVGGDLWFNTDVMKSAEDGIAFVDFLPYRFLAANNSSSGGKSDIVEDSNKAFAHLTEVMKSVLPQRVAEIDRMQACQASMYVTNEMHKAAVFKRKTSLKLKWSTVSVLLRSPVSMPEKASAVMLYFLPRPIYRTFFKLYSKTMLD